MTALGGRPAPFAAVDSRADLDAAIAAIGTPAILKTRRFGYDGKGQARIMTPADADAAWAAVRGAPSVLEGFISFESEFSILLCRAASGEVAIWDAPATSMSTASSTIRRPRRAPSSAAPVAEAIALARKVADALDYVGVLTLEFFAVAERRDVQRDGAARPQ